MHLAQKYLPLSSATSCPHFYHLQQLRRSFVCGEQDITLATMGPFYTDVKAVTYSEMCALKMQRAWEYIFIAFSVKGKKDTY